jgi:hypothetical protein
MPTSWYLLALSGYPKNPWIIAEFGPALTQRAAAARPAKLAFLVDRLSLLSRPDLGTYGRGAQRRG